MQRRRALQLLGAMAGAPALLALRKLPDAELLAIGARAHEALAAARGTVARVLTPAQYRAVETAAEHIIPRTDTPGATDARVADFVDSMLADWYSAAERERFLGGLASLDAHTVAKSRRAFADAPASERLVVLTALDEEVAALRRSDARAADAHWFGMLKFLTVWGYYTSRAGITEALGQQVMPGMYDGNAPVPDRRDTGGGAAHA